MLEFCYELPYEELDFSQEPIRYFYRIGRGEQGVLMVRPYTNDICQYWKFKDETIARESANKIYSMYCDYKESGDFVGMDMARKFLEMGFTRARRYANHRSGKKYAEDGSIRSQEVDALHNEKSKAAKVFKEFRDLVANDPVYKSYRKHWRENIEPKYETSVILLKQFKGIERNFTSKKASK